MRILHLVSHCKRGFGNVHVAVDLACIQAKNGHSVAYASAGGDYVDVLTKFGVRHVELVHNRKNPNHALVAALRLAKLCREFRPDVIHAHMHPGAVLGYVVSRVLRIPLVTTVHNSFDPGSWVMRLSDRVVAVSEAEKQLLLTRGFHADRLDMVLNGPNGSPRDMVQDTEPAPVLQKPAVVTVCGLHKRKGVDHLIRAFSQVANTYPDWNLYIAGWGPDYDSLNLLKEELGVGNRVHLLGYVSNAKGLLAQSDIFVLASLAEPSCLVMGEARGAGCALVGTKVGGIPEQLEHGRAGILVEPANAQQLSEALANLMADPEVLEEAKAKSRKNSERFSIGRVVAEYDQVYDRALRSKGREAACLVAS